MAGELLSMIGGLLVLLIPGILLAGWMNLGADRLERWTLGSTLGLAMAAYLASLVSHLDLRWFYPLWALLGCVTLIGYWRSEKTPRDISPRDMSPPDQPPRDSSYRDNASRGKITADKVAQDADQNKTHWGMVFILLAVAASRLAIALPENLPNGWDPTFHMILARKIQITQHAIDNWMPFEPASLNYPTGSHMLLVILSAITRLPLHTVFKDLLPLLGVLSTAMIFVLARRATRSDRAAFWSAAAYGLWAMSGSIEYWRWGGLPNELAMLFFIAMLAVWLDESAGKHRWFLMAILLSAVILVHHHTMIAGFAILAAAAAISKKSPRRILLLAILAAGTMASFFLIPYIAKIGTISSTYALTHGEPLVPLWDQIHALGMPLVVFAIMGIAIWLSRRSQCHPVIFAACIAMAALFVAGEYVWPEHLLAAGQEASTAFTPTRFFADMNYFLAIFAGIGLAFLQTRFRIPAFAMILLLGIGACLEINQWAALLVDDYAVSPAYIRACQWIQQKTPPTTIIINREVWTPYFAWRRSDHAPIPTSEPWAQIHGQRDRWPLIIAGKIPPDSPDMMILAIDDPAAYPDSSVLWHDPSGLAVIKLWPASP